MAQAAESPSVPSTETAAAGASGTAPYTAVIYFHGMGSQRRLEETSRLIDGLDVCLKVNYAEQNALGTLSKIAPRLEAARDGTQQTYTYIRAYHRTPGGTAADYKSLRFYEAYWAPLMAGERSPAAILKWMFRQVLRPLGTLRSPWRERQRLRRSALGALYESRRAHLDAVQAGDFTTLAAEYDFFEGPDALGAYPGGTFDEFIQHLHKRNDGRHVRAERLESLARAWRRAYWRQEGRNAAALLTIALALLLLAGGAIALALLLLGRTTELFAGTVLEPLAGLAPPTLPTAIGLVTTVGVLLGLGKFLTDYLGDVEAWATYQETNEKHERRAKVIDNGVKLLEHVLRDPYCERVVVMGHSLGSSVAHDALLAALRFNRARNAQDPIKGPIPLLKIEHFVTLGSPIDKIEYFFESYRSEFHRYRRIVEELRGDISTEPFRRNRKPWIHWINFWDDGDPVSGALHSPTGRGGFAQRVDNVHVENLTFPSPGASHTAYFFNRTVIECLLRIILDRAYSFRTLPTRLKQDPDWAAAYIGVNFDRPGHRRLWTGLAALIPWTSLVALIASWLKPDWGAWPWLPTALLAAGLAVNYVFNRGGRPRRPLQRPPGKQPAPAP